MVVTPSWGYNVQGNGVFDGMIGLLQRGEADLGITPAVISLPRLDAVDYTVQTWKLRGTLRPPCVAGSVLCSDLVSGRCLLLVGMLLGVMVQSFYTSAIVTILLTPIPRTIHTVQDLIRSPLKVGLEDFVYTRTVFPNSSDPLLSAMYNGKVVPAWRKRPNGGFFSVAEGVKRIQRGGFAFCSEASTLYPVIDSTFSDDEKCSISEVELVLGNGNAAPIPKGSPFKELFKQGYFLMLERGLRDRNSRRWSAPRPSCESGASALTAVGLDPIFPAHAILLLGLVSALLLLLHERRTAAVLKETPTETQLPLTPLSHVPAERKTEKFLPTSPFHESELGA
ncbi:uncharacterized protein LOC117639031 [Thrips palmi]|uniref:Uncharacterized protein LOC117639031 n=1 Tax=Thrips palmi TaxID=161013 RepID=A0A6P8XTN6_THRPL|nr:uncharacterized protein LOC117639031 [Thrips palmi]